MLACSVMKLLAFSVALSVMWILVFPVKIRSCEMLMFVFAPAMLTLEMYMSSSVCVLSVVPFRKLTVCGIRPLDLSVIFSWLFHVALSRLSDLRLVCVRFFVFSVALSVMLSSVVSFEVILELLVSVKLELLPVMFILTCPRLLPVEPCLPSVSFAPFSMFSVVSAW